MAIPNPLTSLQSMGVNIAINLDAENITKLLQSTASILNLQSQMDTHDAQGAFEYGDVLSVAL
ncbi:hypothetical protein TrVFT333_010494 [Trichoderma virens FT-333]|nr:hypothetical protein TrVFT333_010494 [Trichoderma virens FT-333]